MKLTNNLNLPQPIVDAIANDDYSRGKADISVTQLIGPPRMVALTGAHWNELEEDASDRIFSLMGRAIHKILEQARAGDDVREQRLFMQVGDWTVSGAMDRLAMLPWNDGSMVIQDYKTASTNEMVFGVKVEREQQLNVYRVLAELNGYKVGGLQAVFLLRDWSKVRAALEAKKSSTRLSTAPETGGAYPQHQVVVYDVPMWPIKDAYRYIAERVALHKGAQEAYAAADQSHLPECTDEERWAREPILAIMKEGGKRASKLVETQEEAEEYIAAHPKDKYVVESRPGESVRCAYYCPVAKICDQWKEIQDAG